MPQAERDFLRTALFAKADDPEEAAKAFVLAGRSAFAQGSLSRSLEHTESAISLDANLTEAWYQKAKFLMADDQPQAALSCLRRAIDQVPVYVLAAVADSDFKRYENQLDSFLEHLKQESLDALKPKVAEAHARAVKWTSETPEVAACSAVLNRWSALGPSWPLLDLLSYRGGGFDHDCEQIALARSTGLARIENARRARAEADALARSEEVTRREQKRAALKEYLLLGGLQGAFFGAMALGFAGCVSCVQNAPTQNTLMTDFNLFNGLFRGTLVGVVVGVAIGTTMWSLKYPD